MDKPLEAVRLVREADQVFVHFADGRQKTAVKVLWARPISGRDGEVSLMGPDNREVLMLRGLSDLDAESRRIAEEELARRYLVPRVTRVVHAKASFGVRFWHVETDIGERRFVLKHASKNALWLDDDHLVLRDTLGCRYEIWPFSALDEDSRRKVESVL